MKDVLNLVNFLYRITWRYRINTSTPHIIQIETNGLSNN
jgi:hypothetical protein